ncbi:hypothetical protein Ahy_B10g105095 isoform E [Arachis hypogaea]|uniref:Molybdenum cofactor sulfurase n=1 Tax=Arachis hypogaea TaxID=3818 RepID=A0A444X771_ARAHY|nr:hypothetical protein Ahy_B10g105095 isoform E [Arachis hypogaea]
MLMLSMENLEMLFGVRIKCQQEHKLDISLPVSDWMYILRSIMKRYATAFCTSWYLGTLHPFLNYNFNCYTQDGKLTNSNIETRHTKSLALYTRKMLLALRHHNGSNVCILYGHQSSMELCYEMGPIVSFNLKRPDGSWYGYREVEKLASLSGIQLRTGCFCNPGACAKYLGLSHLDLLSNTEAGHVCWDDHDVINGKPTGAVRVSFGYMSTYEEAKKFIDFVASSFVSSQNDICHGNQLEGIEKGSPDTGCHLKSITIYPIKSCGGFCSRSWPLSKNALATSSTTPFPVTSSSLSPPRMDGFSLSTNIYGQILGAKFIVGWKEEEVQVRRSGLGRAAVA